MSEQRDCKRCGSWYYPACQGICTYPEPQSQLDRLAAERETLRYLLWLHHGHDRLYGDDGEMQCSQCGMDFKRAPIALIQERLAGLVAERDDLEWQSGLLRKHVTDLETRNKNLLTQLDSVYQSYKAAGLEAEELRAERDDLRRQLDWTERDRARLTSWLLTSHVTRLDTVNSNELDTQVHEILNARDEVRQLRRQLFKAQQQAEQLSAILLRVQQAYCGVGDFEGTGSNMVAVMPEVDAVLGNREALNVREEE